MFAISLVSDRGSTVSLVSEPEPNIVGRVVDVVKMSDILTSIVRYLPDGVCKIDIAAVRKIVREA